MGHHGMTRLAFPFALLLASCGGDDYQHPVNGWELVENVRGKTVAQGVALEPNGALWSATVEPGAELDGVSKRVGPIAPGSTIRIRYRVSADGFYPSEKPAAEPILTIMVQRAGDDWLGGDKAGYRQYTAAPMPLTAGEHEAEFVLEPACCVQMDGHRIEGTFYQTLAGAQRVWVAFGYWDGRMHGVKSRVPMTFTLLAFEWEAPE